MLGPLGTLQVEIPISLTSSAYLGHQTEIERMGSIHIEPSRWPLPYLLYRLDQVVSSKRQRHNAGSLSEPSFRIDSELRPGIIGSNIEKRYRGIAATAEGVLSSSARYAHLDLDGAHRPPPNLGRLLQELPLEPDVIEEEDIAS